MKSRKLFQCKVCVEKDMRITDLKAQLEDMRRLAIPPSVSHAIPVLQMEADAILSQKEEVMQLSSEESVEMQRIADEASSLLTGEY